MATGHIRWVPDSSAPLTQHERELELSARRAHSARVSHHKRKKKRAALLERRTSSAQKQDASSESSLSIVQYSIIPSPLTSRGSSDPFGALPIPYTPEVNRMIAFMREAYTPCIYIPTWMRQSHDADLPLSTLVKSRALAGSCGVLRDWQNCLDHPEVQPAWMASNLSAMMEILPAPDRPLLYGIMLQCRQRSLQILRQALCEQAKLDSAPRFSLMLQISLLFREGYIRGSSQGAEAYGVVLQYVEKAYVDNETASNLLSITLYNDAELACRRLKKTMLDFEGWFARRMKDFWAYAETYLPPASSYVVADLHPSLASSDSVVRDAILRARRCIDLSETVDPLAIQAPEDYMAGDLRWAWVASTGLHDMGLLVNRYCDLEEIREDIEDEEQLWKHDIGTAMILATLFSVRKLVHPASCNGVDLREAQSIIPTMAGVLKRALSYATEEQKWKSREPLMWMYFSGAWHGQNIQHQRKRGVFGDRSTTPAWPEKFDATWFDKQLSVQASALGLKRWCDARQLLQRFAFSDLMQPHPTEWYESIVTMHSCDGTGSVYRRRSSIYSLITPPNDPNGQKIPFPGRNTDNLSNSLLPISAPKKSDTLQIEDLV